MPSHPDDSAALAIQTPAINDRSLAAGLAEGLRFALDGLPDPWFEHDKAHDDVRQFEPIAV